MKGLILLDISRKYAACEYAASDPCPDPDAVSGHASGVKHDRGKPRVDLVFNGFPMALMCVAEVATFGAEKYSEHGWKMVPDGLKRYTAAMDRHRLMEAMGYDHDEESGMLHAAHHAWNALARLELLIRDEYARKEPGYDE